MPKGKTYTGGCLCGAITFSITGKPDWPHYCSCTMCQTWSGAPLVGWVDFPAGSVTWLSGTPKRVRTTPKTERGFCADCGSGLFAQDDGSEMICMTIGSIKQKNSLVPESQSYKGSAPKWLAVEIPKPKDEA